jgi:hypothetical protein
VPNTFSYTILAGHQNVQTVTRQIEKIEKQIGESVPNPSLRLTNEEGSDLMEIVEELDEDGNILC